MIYLKNSIEKQKIYIPRTKIDSKLVIKNKTYDDGYSEGHYDGVTEGYASGYDTGFSNGRQYGRSEGKEIQKSKLEDISITENGLYSREDGYKNIVVDVPDVNGSYDDGYEDGSSDGYKEGHYDGLRQGLNDGINYQYEQMVNDSEVLNITENGVYFTRYSKEEDSSEEIPSNNYRNFIRTVNANIVPKINVAKEGIKFANSTFSTIPEWADFEGITDMRYMFRDCTNLTSIPYINTSEVIDMYGLFQGCNLTTIPQLDTRFVTNVSYMFSSCTNLTSIPLLYFPNISTITYFLGFSTMTRLTDLGGFQGLKIDWNDNYGLAKCPNLTYESVMNVINNLYDFRGNGDTSTTRTIKFHANSLALLSEEDKAIAIGKGWILSA